MIIGFTGSRKGMTGDQSVVVARLLLKATEAHHGDCIGADEQFHDLCLALEIPIVIHPPEDDTYRAFCEGAIRVEPPRPFLVRNKDIVNSSELLVATPKEDYEPDVARGQGTWSTVRYARRSSKDFRVVWPEGEWWVP
jgi:hypothetical protein